MPRLGVVCAAQVALLLLSGLARGDEAATAEALFRAGREASDRGDYATACRRFEESYRLDPADGTLLNWAACEEKQQRLTSAWQRYRHVAERLAPTDDRMALVKQRIAALDARLPRLSVKPKTGSSVGEVLQDGIVVKEPAFGVPLPIDPGEHHVLVKTPNRQDREYVVVLGEAERVGLEIEPGAPVVSPSPAPLISNPQPRTSAPAPSPPNSSRAFAYAALGGGAAALLVGGITGALFLERKSFADDRCPTTSTCDDEGLKAAGAADRLRLVTIVSAGLGVAALATGLVLLELDADNPPEEGALRVRVGITTSGLRAAGRF